MSTLTGKTVLLVVGGGIAAYKSVLLARELQRRGAVVEVVLSEAAQRFVTALTFAGVTGRAVHTSLWDDRMPGELHVALTDRADVVVVAPATADLLAKMTHGLGDDLASVCLLCAQGPVVVAPAMHTRMWDHPATQANLATLRDRGIMVSGPDTGPLASGAVGIGRMREPEALADDIAAALGPRDLLGMRVLITAGGTHEAIDPVRFVGNRSSGKMGYALALAARDRGATVTLVHGPTALADPAGVACVAVRSAQEMYDAVMGRWQQQDAVVMAAAVADYRPAVVSTAKIKKSTGDLRIDLVHNPDILASLGALRGGEVRPVLVGFAVETGDLIAYAREKLARKRCDLLVANRAEDGFEGDDNRVVLVYADAEIPLERQPKRAVAERIWDAVRRVRGRSDEAGTALA